MLASGLRSSKSASNDRANRLRSVSSDHADPTAIAEEVATLWDAFAARAVSVREAWERDPSAGPGGGLVDVELGQLHTAPMEAVHAIYKSLGLTLSEAAEGKMRRWVSAPRQLIRPIGAEGLNRRPPAGACRLFRGPGFRLAAR